MKLRITKDWIFSFCERLLQEAGVSDEAIENDLESLIYEAGMRGWDEYEDDYGDEWYIVSPEE